jgi:hypothetical protein
MTDSHRQNFWLVGAALAIVIAVVGSFWPDGLITLNFTEAPVSKVIASIERQGHIRLTSNVPPETPVTIQMKRVPLMDALETLAVRIEGDLRVVYTGALTKARVKAGLDELAAGKFSDEWKVTWVPGGGMFGGEIPPDPRSLTVKPEAGEKNDLQSALQQVAIKSGVMAATPKDWNPDVKMPTKPASAATLVQQLIASSGGKVQESFWIVGRGGQGGPNGDSADQGGGNRRGQGGQAGGPQGGRERINPEWMAQRAEAVIAQLPPEEQKVAKADFDEMRKFWEEVRALPEDQRRPKMEEFFDRPEVQDKMEQRQEARDSRRSPQQREARMSKYLQRKEQMKSAPTNP